VVSDNPRIEDLRRRVQRDPASIAFAQLAEECRRAGQFQESVEICRVGLAIHPGYLSARVTLGRALIEMNQPDEAQAELEHVLKSAPENLAALRGLGEIHEGRGNLSEALLHYRAALNLAKNDPDLQETVNDLSQKVEPPAALAAAEGLSLEMDDLPPARPSVPVLAVSDAALPPPFVGAAPAAAAPDDELHAIPLPADHEPAEEAAATLDLGSLEAGALETWVAAEPAAEPVAAEPAAAEPAAAELAAALVAEPHVASAVAGHAPDATAAATPDPLSTEMIAWLDAAPSRIVPPAAPASPEPAAQAAAALDPLPTDMIAWLDAAAPLVTPEAPRAAAPVARPAAFADDETDIQSGARLDPLALRTIGALEKWLDAIHVSRTHLGA
jgi:tetratricopeptide (TPR) repeat protein